MPEVTLRNSIDRVEEALITAILDGELAIGSTLPSERELAARLGVTRPTLREVLRRLERDGWLIIQQGKPTVIKDFWWDGGLGVISGIVRHSKRLHPEFVTNLLKVRLAMAPAYTREAVELAANDVVALVEKGHDLPDTPGAFAAFDWQVQRGLTIASGNPVYAMILNGFAGFYESLAQRYFVSPNARTTSRQYYAALLKAAQEQDAAAAEEITRTVMNASVRLWQAMSEGMTLQNRSLR